MFYRAYNQDMLHDLYSRIRNRGLFFWAGIALLMGAANVDQPESWPYRLDSPRYPLTVHYLHAKDTQQAKDTLRHLEKSWHVQVEQLGFSPPYPSDDTGQNRLRVYMSRGSDSGVEGVEPLQKPGVWWDAYTSYITVDPWGKYGGAIYPVTLTHEFHHTLQAADDWYESPAFFETSATYIQTKVFPEDRDYLSQIIDFQAHPDWAPAYHDDYKTWYSYGAALYLIFLEQNYFAEQPDFLANIWRGARNGPRPLAEATETPQPETNEPDWIDALETQLPMGVTYLDTLIDFARWRYITGISNRTTYPWGAVKLAARLKNNQGEFHHPGPQLTGSIYLAFERPPGGEIELEIEPQRGIKWKPQVLSIDTRSTGEFLQGTRLNFGKSPALIVIISAMPDSNAYDPDEADDFRYPLNIRWHP